MARICDSYSPTAAATVAAMLDAAQLRGGETKTRDSWMWYDHVLLATRP